MLEVLKEYIEDDMQVTEYTKDGNTVSHVVKVVANSVIPEGEVLPVQPTFEQRIKGLEEENSLLQSQNMELMLAVAELSNANETDKIETQLAIAELANMVTGGGQ